MEYIPYTYHIYHARTNQHYYGVSYRSGAHPSKFWVKYFSSSWRVHKLIEEYGKDSFVVEIRKTFKNADEARRWEHKVLRRLKVTTKQEWLNMSDGLHHMPSEKGRQSLSKHRNGVPRTWVMSEQMRNRIIETQSGSYTIRFPDGHVENITNMSKFCRDQGLTQSIMARVANGKVKTHKGYTVI